MASSAMHFLCSGMWGLFVYVWTLIIYGLFLGENLLLGFPKVLDDLCTLEQFLLLLPSLLAALWLHLHMDFTEEYYSNLEQEEQLYSSQH